MVRPKKWKAIYLLEDLKERLKAEAHRRGLTNTRVPRGASKGAQVHHLQGQARRLKGSIWDRCQGLLCRVH
jgi:hypothetical protein